MWKKKYEGSEWFKNLRQSIETNFSKFTDISLHQKVFFFRYLLKTDLEVKKWGLYIQSTLWLKKNYCIDNCHVKSRHGQSGQVKIIKLVFWRQKRFTIKHWVLCFNTVLSKTFFWKPEWGSINKHLAANFLQLALHL